MSPDSTALGRRALARHGVFTRRDAHEHGFSNEAIAGLAFRGEWTRLHESVFVAASQPCGPLQLASAAVLAVPGSALSHLSALALDELAPWPHLAHITVAHGQRRSLPGVVVHQSRVLDPDDVRLLRGVPTTTMERSLIDCGGYVGDTYLTVCIDEALRLRRTDVERLAQRSLDLRPDGRFGGAAVRRVLASRPPQDERHDSVLESLMARLMQRAGLTEYVHHHVVKLSTGGAELDFAFVERRVDVETDGRVHDREEQRRWDERRDAALRRLGWVVLRFRWEDVVGRPAWVLRRIRASLGV